MLCGSRNRCSFYFLPSQIKNLLVRKVFVSGYLKLSLPIFLKCSLIYLFILDLKTLCCYHSEDDGSSGISLYILYYFPDSICSEQNQRAVESKKRICES